MEAHTNATRVTNNAINDANNVYNANCTHSSRSSEQENKRVSLLPSWFVVQLTLTASLGGCLFGYDMGAISGTLPQLANTFDLNDGEKELTVSILYIGGAVGGCIGGRLCDQVGRKATIMLTDVVFILGALLLYFATAYTEVVIGRFVVGIGVAVSGVADVSYLHECSPIKWRGSIVSVNEACISLGFLLAYIAGYVFGDGAEEWRIVFGMAGILAAFQFIGMLLLPESPAWLIEKGNINAANRALERINGTNRCTDINGNRNGDEGLSSLGWGSNNHEPTFSTHQRRTSGNSNCDSNFIGESGIRRINSQSPLREIDLDLGDTSPSSFGIRNSTVVNGSFDPLGDESTGLLRSLKHNIHVFLCSRLKNLGTKVQANKLTLSRYRHQVYIAIFLAVAQQFCGQTNILSYAPLIFAEAMKQDSGDGGNANDDENNIGETKDMSMIIIGLVKFFVTVLVIWRIEYIGRRFLLICGNLLIATGLLALVIAFGGSSDNVGVDDDTGDAATSWSPLTNIKTFHLALPGVLLVVCGYSMSFGPLTWLLTSEIFPTAIRGRALGYTTILSYMCAAISTETFLYTQSIFGPSFVFGVYCVITVAGVMFAYLAIPDTGAKTVEQIDESLSRMFWWKYSAIALSQNDEDFVHGEPASSSRSEMVQNPSQLSVHTLT